MQEQNHEMSLMRAHPSGAEEWYCPICGRRFLLQWPPAYEMIVLDVGDPYVQHTGRKGILRTSPVQVEQASADSQEISEKSLRPWIKAIEKLDIDWEKRVDLTVFAADLFIELGCLRGRFHLQFCT